MSCVTGMEIESGKIYRNSNGIFCYVCVHCGAYFDNINETLSHIDNHFSDGTINVTTEDENKPTECTESLEFISITTDTRSDLLKVEHEAEETDVGSDDWLGTTSNELMMNAMAGRKSVINCSYCSESFPNRLFLVLHSEIHHPNQPIEGIQTSDVQCDGCLIEFDTPTKLEEHLSKDHATEESVDTKVDVANTDEFSECKVCRRSFKTKHLKRLLQRSTCKEDPETIQVGEFPFYCDICGHGFPHKFRLIQHMSQRHMGKENKCKYCNQRYVLDTSLRKHERYECSQRPNADENEAINRNDTSTGVKKKPCGGYRESKNLQGPKMFSCEFCDKVYDTHYKLKQHLLSHANLREFKCDQCDKQYNTKPRLRRHYIYNHTDHPTFDCEVCGWKFREKNNLKRHMRLHNGDYQAQCQICEKKFMTNCHLKYHMNGAQYRNALSVRLMWKVVQFNE